MRARHITSLLVASLVFITSVFAQSPNGTISGVVIDPSEAAIAGAEITIVNDATRVQYSTKTNNEGIYVVPNLPPGPYRIQVLRIGFKTLIKPDVTLNVQDAVAINFTLPIGAASET
ncbi:MAG: carboxypeptidase-like regulatory domain-containing protein, partial [Candidatus Acidiferrales bacterium]